MLYFIEIGASSLPEFTYLLNKNWRASNTERLEAGQEDSALPYLYAKLNLYERWHGVFVEMCPFEFVELLQAHKDYDNAQHILCPVGIQHFQQFYKYTHVEDKLKMPFWCFPISLDDLLLKTGITPDVIRMDIEGMEFEVLPAYSFNIKPKYFFVETHDNTRIDEIDTLFQRNGYTTKRVFDSHDEERIIETVIIAERTE